MSIRKKRDIGLRFFIINTEGKNDCQNYRLK